LLIWSVVAIGAAYAAIGIFALSFMPNGRVFAALPRIRFSVVTSTFVNQNHYVTFAGIGFIAAIGLTLRLYRRQLSGTGPLLRLKIAALIEATGSRGALPLALVFVILTGVVLSGVRGGIIATGVGFFALLVLSARRGKHSRWREAVLLIFAVVASATSLSDE
jgi:hypothetical protein